MCKQQKEAVTVIRKLIGHLQLSFEGEEGAAEAYGINEDLDRARRLLKKLEK